MSVMPADIVRLLHTVRYLKPIQIYGRVWFRLLRPKAVSGSALPRRTRHGEWAKPLTKPASMLGPNRFRFLNEERSLKWPGGWNDPALEKLWLYNLHYFDDLNAVEAGERHDWHRDLIDRWIAENPPAEGDGWEPYPLSLRIVNWIKWVLSGNELHPEALQSLANQTRYLRKRLEYHLLGNHLFANAKALVFAGLFFDGAEAQQWLNKGLMILNQELPEQILDDGGHFERSPMYHAIILEDLLDLINMLRTYNQPLPQPWESTADKMLSWLTGMRHPDGEIVLFNDAAFGIAPKPEELFAYANRLGFDAPRQLSEELKHFASTGYLRWQKGPATAFLDTASIGPDYLPGHAHADTLSFELSLFGKRVVVDSGTSCYGVSDERLRQRGTSAHNTVTINGEDSSEVWGGFRVARRAKPVVMTIETGSDSTKVACSHTGYQRLSGKPIHQREWVFNKTSLRINDAITGSFEEAVGRFHLHPDIDVAAEEGASCGQLALPGGETVGWEVSGGSCDVADSTWHPEFGISIPNKCLKVRFSGPEASFMIQW